MSDLLSASSLLIAIAALLFSLWYPEIAKALEVQPKAHREDNVRDKKLVSSILFSKALPVAVMTMCVSFIFLPDAIKLMHSSFLVYQADLQTFKNYDAVATAYCFVTLLALILAIFMWIFAIKLFRLRKKLM